MKKQSNLSRLMEYAGPRRILTYMSWGLSALSALIALVPFWYIWCMIRDVLAVAPDFGEADNLPHYGWMAVLYAVVSMIIYTAALMCSHIAAFRVASNLRIQCVHHIAKLPMGAAENFGSGKLRKIVNESSAATETFLAHQLPDKAGAIATPIGLMALLFAFDWRLGIASLIPVALGFLIMMSMTGKKMEQKMKEYQDALDSMSNEAVEYVRGIPVVKTFGQTVFSFKKFKASIDNYKKWVIAYTKDLRLPMMCYTTAINGVFAFLIGAGILFTRDGVTDEFLLNLLFYIIITPVISLTLTKIMFMSENEMIVADALARIDSILDLEPLSESKSCEKPKDYSVELSHVSFGYDENKEIIHDVSMKIEQGQTVALVGPSGGGKSTLASLVSRFFDPQKGKIMIGSTDIKDISKEELMNTVSFVFQDSHIIKASILDNVKLGKPQASLAEVMEVLEAACCKDIIEKFPMGVNTVIGTKGVYLSGGEQQRIAIARAMLKNTPVIILDEASAFADPDNEIQVQKAFSSLAKDKTVIMIAHRLSTVANADIIYVVQDGRIVEAGDKDRLQANNGLFAKMWKDYQTSVKWKVSREE